MWFNLVQLECKVKKSKRPWLLLLVLCLASLVDHWLGNDGRMGVRADPGTITVGAILWSIAISGATTAATYVLQRLLTKPSMAKRGQRTGTELIQDSQYGSFINEIYGAPPVDGLGGVKIGGNIIDCSTIRPVVSTTTESSGGGKGGGGKTNVETTTYYQDVQISFGRGPLDFLKIFAVDGSGTKIIYSSTPDTVTGVIDPDFPAEVPQDYYTMPDPQILDTNPEGRHGHIPTPTAEGSYEFETIASGNVRLYPGNEDQLPDPLFEALHGGPGTTPAYRGQAVAVLENVDVSNGLPTFWALLAHQELTTVGAIAASRAKRAGLLDADLDFTDLDIPVRGLLVDQRQAPRADMEMLGRVYDCDFLEGFEGKVVGSPIAESLVATLTAEDINWATDEHSTPSQSAQQKDPTDFPRSIDFSYIEPTGDYETGTKTSSRQVTTSQRADSFDVRVTLTGDEAQKVADRELQEAWREQGAWSFTSYHKFAWLEPGQKISVPFDGRQRTVRIKEITGAVPGVLTFAVTPQEGVVVPSPFASYTAPEPTNATVPANTVVTLIDLPPINSQQDTPGMMAAVAPKDLTSGEWRSAILYVNKGSGWQFLQSFDTPATMGRVITDAMPDVPVGYVLGDWEDDTEITVDLFYGSLETLTEAQVLNGGNLFIIGNELVGVTTWTRVTGQPNRWTGSHMQRQLRGTVSTGHAVNERFVQLNSAVKFVRLDESEINIERTYRAVTVGLSTTQRIEDAADVLFTWSAMSLQQEFTAPVISRYGTAGVDSVSIGVEGFSESARKQRLQIAESLSLGALVDPTVVEFDGSPPVIDILRSGAFSPTFTWLGDDPAANGFTKTGSAPVNFNTPGWRINSTGLNTATFYTKSSWPATPFAAGFTLELLPPLVLASDAVGVSLNTGITVDDGTSRYVLRFSADKVSLNGGTEHAHGGLRVRLVITTGGATADLWIGDTLTEDNTAAITSVATGLVFGDLVTTDDASTTWFDLSYALTPVPVTLAQNIYVSVAISSGGPYGPESDVLPLTFASDAIITNTTPSTGSDGDFDPQRRNKFDYDTGLII